MIFGVVQKHMNPSLERIHNLDGHQERNRSHGIDRQRLDHACVSGFQINRAVDIQAIAPTGLLDRDFGSLLCPTTRWPHRVRRMHGIRKHNGFVVGQIVQKIVIGLDKSGLFGGIKLF